jgi:methionine salvage enolase-phosphatase E1
VVSTTLLPHRSVYEDVIPFLKRLAELNIPTYIYSSGSVHAQKLLFGHTAAGATLLIVLLLVCARARA